MSQEYNYDLIKNQYKINIELTLETFKDYDIKDLERDVKFSLIFAKIPNHKDFRDTFNKIDIKEIKESKINIRERNLGDEY